MTEYTAEVAITKHAKDGSQLALPGTRYGYGDTPERALKNLLDDVAYYKERAHGEPTVKEIKS